ncbi:MAG: enoyl-CoA hydratase/isomerase family protein [Syntrophomonadaceae bacterium]|jgi:enoyl-CoA hydratase/carnithine racemase
MADFNYQTLLTEVDEQGILWLTLNRPEKLNSVNNLMLDELSDLWARLRHDLKVRVVIMRGSPESKGFCGGLDLSEPIDPENANTYYLYDWQSRLGRLQLAMRQIPQPIIAVVHGAAAGAGFSFAMASDIRVISTDARFSAFYVNVGLGGADMGCSYFLPRLIGAGRAYEFMLTGRFMSAEEAVALGFVSKCVERDQLTEAALELANLMVAKDYMAMRLTKEAINMNLDCGGLENALKMEDRNQIMLVMHNLSRGKAGIGK